MSLKEIAEKATQSKIWRLTKDGTILGFRVKSYNIQSNSFDYYDFDIDILKSLPELLEFFRGKVSSFDINTLKSVNGRLYTQEELDGIYEAKELVSNEDVVRVLQPVILLYKGGYFDV